MASVSCGRNPLLVNVAAADDIAPAIQQVGRYFNRLHRRLDRRCVEVQVAAVQPAIAAAMVDGKTPPRGRPAIDAWIPDSSLWVGVARSRPVGAQRVQTTGIDVARSPLMIVMPRSAASRRHPLGSSTGWNFLLPPSAGGPPSADGVQVELPDPEQSSAGLATVVEMGRLLGTGPASRENFSRFVFGAHVTAQYDSPAALESLVALAKPPQDQIPVTVASEQAVVQYDLAHPDRPLAARYPSGGTPELDYPYVLTTTSRLELTAAAEFGKVLAAGLRGRRGPFRRLPLGARRGGPDACLLRAGQAAATAGGAGEPGRGPGHAAGLEQAPDRHPPAGAGRHFRVDGTAGRCRAAPAWRRNSPRLPTRGSCCSPTAPGWACGNSRAT